MTDDPRPSMDPVRRKLLKGSAALGGLLAAGNLPWGRPAVKSFFGTPPAWAQPTGPACAIVAAEGVATCIPALPGEVCLDVGDVGNGLPTSIFSLENTGSAPFEFIDFTFVICGPTVAPLPEISIAPTAPSGSDPVEPGSGVGFTLTANCEAPTETEFCFEFLTDPPMLCNTLRLRVRCVPTA
jgi:hypothetical protein